MEPSVSEIQEILRIFLDSELQELRLEIGSVRLAVSKTGAMQAFGESTAPLAASAPPPRSVSGALEAPGRAAEARPATGVAPHADWIAVKAPSVGTFYRRPSPDQPPFVDTGAVVAEGDPVFLIEVMKMFTRVAAPAGGRVAAILAEDGDMVEYDQTLLYIEPA